MQYIYIVHAWTEAGQNGPAASTVHTLDTRDGWARRAHGPRPLNTVQSSSAPLHTVA